MDNDKAKSRITKWTILGQISGVMVVGLFLLATKVFEEGSTQVRITIILFTFFIIFTIVCYFKWKEAKADSLHISVDQLNEQNRQNAQKIRNDYYEAKKPKIDEQGNIKCPKCGSTQIQLMQRGFSVTTGFIGSNKINRVCVHCKHKF